MKKSVVYFGCCLVLLWMAGCQKFSPTAPASSSTLDNPTATVTPNPACLLFSAVNLPSSPSGGGNYVIRNTADWEAYNNCASGMSCPVPPVDFQKQMLLVTETLYAHGCSCTPLSEAVSSVCSDGSSITVDVHQTLPPGCGPAATPGVCTLAPVTLQSAVAVAASGLPVTWVFESNP